MKIGETFTIRCTSKAAKVAQCFTCGDFQELIKEKRGERICLKCVGTNGSIGFFDTCEKIKIKSLHHSNYHVTQALFAADLEVMDVILKMQKETRDSRTEIE